jgi:hypothetical protein
MNQSLFDIPESFKIIYRNFLWFAVPFLILLWFIFLCILLMDIRIIIFLPFFYILTCKIFHILTFISDRNLCLIFGYYELQKYLHENFEPDTKWLRFKQFLGVWIFFFPYYRCRAVLLKTWWHYRKREGYKHS